MEQGYTEDGMLKVMEQDYSEDGILKVVEQGYAEDGILKAMEQGYTEDGMLKVMEQGYSEDGILKVVEHGYIEENCCIHSHQIFRLEPRIAGLEMCDEEPLEGLKEETVTSEKKADKIRDLTNLYGSKKAKARALKMESLNQKEDPSAEGDMARKIEGLVINKEDLDTIAYTARNIPPHDSTAMIPERAYPLDKIIFKGEWDYLLDVLELLQSGAEIRPNSHPSFVCNRIHRLMEIQDETERKVLACIFSYITHLLKFKDQRSVDNAASAKQHKIPAILRQKFSKMFEDSGSFRLSIEKTNLLISYVLVLTLFADNFRTDLSDIAKDLRMTPVSLRQHYEYLGCKFSRVDQVLLVTLPVPLEFPKQRMHRRRK
ncbi:hypothetical protein NE237_031489 [Protea cynaroides]|uniref:Uncharacterized protein n=1 Tax=Protea cynaroides TaxID=273540 RepID=A0A9Q0R2K0_9MAGN|nr:hypothetical protein NE237_031489 [Protea cynaroides]